MKNNQEMALRNKILGKWIKQQRGQTHWLHLPILLSMAAYSASSKASENSELVNIQGQLAEAGKVVDKVVVLQGDTVVQAAEMSVTAENFQLALLRQGLQANQPLIIKVIASDGTEFTYLLQSASADAAIAVSYSSTLHHALIDAGQLSAETTQAQFLEMLSEGGQYTNLMAAAKTVVDYDLPEIRTDSVFDIYGHFMAQGEAYMSAFREQYQVEFTRSYELLSESNWGAAAEVVNVAEGLGAGALLAGALGVAAVAAGGGGGSDSDSGTAPTTEADPISGTVTDGYIQGATVFLDKDGDRVQDADEAGATTDQFGNFTLADGEGDLVSIGGTDTSTGKAVTQVYVAPSGATQVNPLTTLVAGMMEDGQTEAQALAKVAAVFGLDAGVDILQTDLLGDAIADDGTANASLVNAQISAVTVATVVEQLTRMLIESYNGTLTDAQSNQVSLVAFDVVSQALLADEITLDETDDAADYAALFNSAAANPTLVALFSADANFAATAAATEDNFGDFAEAVLDGFSTITTADSEALANAVTHQLIVLDTLDNIENGDVTLADAGTTYNDILGSEAFNDYKADLGNFDGNESAVPESTNQAPTVSAALTSATNEADAAYTLDLLAGATDPEGAALRVSNVTYTLDTVATGNEGADLPGGITLNGNTLSVDPTDLAFDGLTTDETAVIEVSYTIADGSGGFVAQTATVTVTGVNDAPAVVALTLAANEGQAAGTLDLLAGATDAEEQTLSVTGITYTVDGQATSNAGVDLPAGVTLSTNTLSVDPTDDVFNSLAAGETTVIVASYTVDDGNGGITPQTATITLTGTNDAPTVAAALTSATNEADVAYDLDLLDGAADVDASDQLNVSNISYTVDAVATGNSGADLPAGITLSSGSTITVDPTDAAFNSLAMGETTVIVVSYTISDRQGQGQGHTVSQTETITITGTNDVPTVAAALTSAANEADAAYNLDLLAGVADVDTSDQLSVTGMTYTVDGVATLNAGADLPAGVTLTGNTLNVDPTDAVFDSLAVGETTVIVASYSVDDGNGGTVLQTETITLTGTNDVPTVAAALTSAANEGNSAYDLELLELASDVDASDQLSVTGMTYTVDGVATANAGADLPAGLTLSGSTLSVDPTDATFDSLAAGETSVIVASYTITDSNGGTVSQTETITITGTNDAPVVQNVIATGVEDITQIGQLFATDVDSITSDLMFQLTDDQVGTRVVDGDSVVLTLPDTQGIFTLFTTGSYNFVPDSGYDPETGLDITYQVFDGTDTSTPATLSLQLAAVDEAPVGIAQTLSMAEDAEAALTGTVSATDAENAELTYSVVGNPVGGTVVLQMTGGFSFSPTADFAGEASFQFVAFDGVNYSDPQTITITVTPVNDKPEGSDLSLTTDEGQALTGQLVFSDVDDTAVTFSQIAPANNGTVDLNTDTGAFTFTPDANFFGTASFQYKVNDGDIDSDTHTVTIEVAPLATTPVLTVDHNVISPTEIGLAISISETNPAPGEAAYVRISNLPVGATLSAGTLDAGSYLLDTTELANLVLTTSNATDVVALTIEAYAVLDGVSSVSATDTVSEAARKLADTPDVTVTATAVDEDNALSLDIQVASGEANPGASEETFTITLSDIPAGYGLSSTNLGPITVTNGAVTFANTDLVGGTIPGLELSAPGHMAESVDITLTVEATEPGSHDTAETSQSLTLTYNPVVDGVDAITVVNGPSFDVDEGSTVSLDISAGLVDTDGSESLVYQLSGVPATATLNGGTLQTTANGESTYLLDVSQAAALQITLPENASAATATYSLTATAVVSEQGVAVADTSTTQIITINAAPVADVPVITVNTVATEVSTEVALDISATISANDTLTVELSGYPAGTTFNAGTVSNAGLANELVTLAAGDLSGLTMTLPSGADDFSLAVDAYTTAGSSQSAVVETPLAVDVLHAPEASVVTVTPSMGDSSFVIDIVRGANTLDEDILLSSLPLDAYVINSAGATVGSGGLGLWVLDDSELDANGLTVVSPGNATLSASINVTVTANSEADPAAQANLSTVAAPVAATVATVQALDPLVLDLNGDGQYHLTSVTNGAVPFDMDLDGDTDSTAWVGPQDGLLVHDLNNNNQIDDVSELFSERYNNGDHESGSAALATLDTNNDGLITTADTDFSALQVWVDANQNAVADSGELTSLTDRNITEINLDTQVSGGAVSGNTIVGEGSFVINGETQNYADVALNYYPSGDAASNSSAPVISLSAAQISVPEGAEVVGLGLAIDTIIDTVPFVLISGVEGGVLEGSAQQVPGTTGQYMVYGAGISSLSNLNFIPDADFSGELNLSMASMAYVPGSGMQFSPVQSLVIEVFAAPELTVDDVQTTEDQAVILPLTLTYEDTAAQALDQLTVSGIPEGAILKVGEAAVTVNNGTAVITDDLLTALRAGDELSVTPVANSADDFALELEARVSDLDSDASASRSATVEVEVIADADAPVLTLDNPALEILPGQTIDLGASLALQDLDGSEYATILVSGLPASAMLTQGIPFGGTYYLSPAQLADASLVLFADAEDFTITITAMSSEVENGDTEQVIGNLSVTVPQPLQTPDLELTAAAQVDEDAAIALTIELSDAQAGETMTVLLSGLPDGAQLRVDGAVLPDSQGVYSLAPTQLADVSILPPLNFSGQLQLNAEVVAVLNDQETRATDSLSVKVIAVADAPQLAAVSDVQVAEAGTADLGLSSAMVSLTDTDGSEQLEIRISGLPAGAQLSAGKLLSDGSVAVKPADLNGLSLTVDYDVPSFDLQVSAVSRESTSGDTANSVIQTLRVDVSQVAEAADLTVSAATGNEDSAIALAISVQTEPGEVVTVLVSNVPDDAELSAGNRNAAGVYQLTVDELEGLSLTASNPGSFILGIEVQTAVNGSASSSSEVLPVVVEAVADQAVITAPDLMTAIEGELVPFDIDLNLPQGSAELVALEISGVPAGAQLLTAGGIPMSVVDGVATLQSTSLAIVNTMMAGLQLQAPLVEGDGAEFVLTVKATSTENNGNTVVSESNVTLVVNDQFSVVPGLQIAAAEGNEDAPVMLDIMVMSPLPEDQLTVVISNLPEGVTLSAGTLQAEGYHLTLAELQDLSLLAPENYFGEFRADVRVEAAQDSGSVVSTADVLKVTVTPINDLPVVSDVVAAVIEDGNPVIIDLSGNDVDPGDTLSYQLTGSLDAGQGTLVNNENGTLTFAPGTDFQALKAGETLELSVDYTATDSKGGVSELPASVTITVTGANDAPVAAAVSGTAEEDGTAVTLNFSGSDIDGDTDLVYSITTALAANQGSVVNNNDGTFTFNPGSDFQSLAAGEQTTVSFDYIVTDKAGEGFDSAAETVTLTITGVNDAPEASALETLTTENGALITAAFIGNDPDTDAALSFEIVEGISSEQGLLTNNNNGSFSYDANGMFEALAEGEETTVTFTYRAVDEHNSVSEPVTATITIQGNNDAPVVTAVNMNADEDGGQVSGNLTGSDVDNTAQLTYALVDDLSTGEGVVTLNTDGSFDYDPGENFQDLAEGETRDISFSYRATDEQGSQSNIAQATVTVTGANDAPVVSAVNLVAHEEGGAVQGRFSGSDADNSAQLTYSLVEALTADQGTVTLNTDGSFDYDPGANFQDLAEGETQDISFSYRATDEQGAQSNSSQVTVTVTGVNDAPVAAAVAGTAEEDGGAVTLNFAGSDIDGDTDLVYSITTTPGAGQGSLNNNDDGTFTFNPGRDFQSLATGEQTTVSFDYTVTDKAGEGLTSSANTVTLTVTGVNDAPEAADLSATVRPDAEGLLVVSGQLEGQDMDGDDLTYEIVTDVSAGTLTLDAATGAYSYSYDPATGDFSDASFTYRVSDGVEFSEAAQVTLLGNTIIADGLDPKEVRGSEVDENIYLIDSGYTVNAGSGNDLIAMLSSAINDEEHALLGGSGQDTYVLVAQAEQALHVNAVIADYDAAEGDRIDLSQLLAADGQQLTLDDVVANATAEGVDLVLDLDNFQTAEGQSVSGELVVVGGNMNTMLFELNPGNSALNQLDELDPLKDYIS
ncbi:MAG: tandem-95 repeat protein [Pontibacterium sp.]